MKQSDRDSLISILGTILTTSTAKNLLVRLKSMVFGVDSLRQQCVDAFPECAGRPVRDLVVEFDRMARLYCKKKKGELNSNADLEMFEQLWATARLLECFGQESHPPLCKFCFRTVEMRSNERPMDYCSHHAQSGKANNPAGYVRGRKAFPVFEKRLKEICSTTNDGEPIDIVWETTGMLLKKQYHFANAGGGGAAYLLKAFLTGEFSNPPTSPAELNKFDSPNRLFDDAAARLIRIDKIEGKFPSLAEIAQGWRSQVGDVTGYKFLQANPNRCVGLNMLLQQWVRYVAWYDFGDRTARVGSGRPSRIDSDQIQKMLNENMSKAEIARRFGVKPGSVYAHVARKATKDTAPKVEVEAVNANDN